MTISRNNSQSLTFILCATLSVMIFSCTKKPQGSVNAKDDVDQSGNIVNPAPGGSKNLHLDGTLTEKSGGVLGGNELFASTQGRKIFSTDAQNYVVGLGLDVDQAQSVSAFVVMARALYGDGTLGPIVGYVNGANRNSIDLSTVNSQTWDFVWRYDRSYQDSQGRPQERVLTGISFDSMVTKAVVAKRTLGPGTQVGSVVYRGLVPSAVNDASAAQSVRWFTSPDLSAQAGQPRFYVITGLYVRGSVGITNAAIQTMRLFSSTGSSQTGQLQWRLDDPRTEHIKAEHARNAKPIDFPLVIAQSKP